MIYSTDKNSSQLVTKLSAFYGPRRFMTDKKEPVTVPKLESITTSG
jgi:hypothetical protein